MQVLVHIFGIGFHDRILPSLSESLGGSDTGDAIHWPLLRPHWSLTLVVSHFRMEGDKGALASRLDTFEVTICGMVQFREYVSHVSYVPTEQS
jgi:hypothetical protein